MIFVYKKTERKCSTPEAKLVPVELEHSETSHYIGLIKFLERSKISVIQNFDQTYYFSDVSTLYGEEARKTEPLRRVLMPNRPEIIETFLLLYVIKT